MKTSLVVADRKLRGDSSRTSHPCLSHLHTFIARLGRRSRPFFVIGLAGAMAWMPWTGNLAGRAGNVQATGQPSAAERASRAQVSGAYGSTPLSFEVNQGQADSRVKYLARGNGYTVMLTSTEAVLSLSQSSAHLSYKQAFAFNPDRQGRVAALLSTEEVPSVASSPTELRMRLVGANPAPSVEGVSELPGRSNYLIGADPEKWQTGVRHYARVQYKDIYPGVDLIYYGNQRQLEYDLVVAPGANPGVIKLGYEGAGQVQVDSTGELVLATAEGELRQHQPVIYQEVNGSRLAVAGRYTLTGPQSVGFELGDYDQSKPLVIDPVLSYSTYISGFGDDFTNNIAIDGSGNTYITGSTDSTNFLTKNPLQPNSGGQVDAFVTKLDTNGALVYSTYIGGGSDDAALSIAVDSTGAAYITGGTSSSNYPTTPGALQTTTGGGIDVFVTKLNPAGSALAYSTFIGSFGDETGTGIAVDLAGNAYLTGKTQSTNFPTANAFQATKNGPLDAFVTKLNPAGSALVYSTFLGGGGNELANAIAIDSAGNAYVGGVTNSSNFPLLNAFRTFGTGTIDAFVTKLTPAGALSFSSYLGGNNEDVVFGIAADSTGAYLTGLTNSTDFHSVNALQPNPGALDNGFLMKLSPAGGIIYSTYLGGKDDDTGFGIAVDASGNVYVAGFTASSDFPTANPSQSALNGLTDAFVMKVNAAGNNILFSSFLGGSGNEQGYGVAVDGSSNIYVTGITTSVNFPVVNAAQSSASGKTDSFVVKISAVNNNTVASVSAASYNGTPVATEAILAGFGSNLATTTASASTIPLPTNLGGTTVSVRDSSGTERLSPLFFVSATQVNYQIPAGTIPGTATLTITSGNGTVSTGVLQVAAVAPGIFAADASGSGFAAAQVLRVKPDGTQVYENTTSFNPVQNKVVAVPIDLNTSDQVFLILYGTGLRFRNSLSSVLAQVGGTSAQVLYAGPQGTFVGLDQVNIALPKSLAGRGDTGVLLTVDGITANLVGINIK